MYGIVSLSKAILMAVEQVMEIKKIHQLIANNFFNKFSKYRNQRNGAVVMKEFLSPSLKMVITLAVFNWDGTIPIVRDMLISFTNTSGIRGNSCLIILLDKISNP